MAKPPATRHVSLRQRLGELTEAVLPQWLDAPLGPWPPPRAFAIDADADVYVGRELVRVRMADDESGVQAIVVITPDNLHQRLHLHCDQCGPEPRQLCPHAACALAFLLEHRLELGLHGALERSSVEQDEGFDEARRQAVAERRARAQREPMLIRSNDPATPWTDYSLTSRKSGRTYRVALRGMEAGESFCSCPDYRSNQLGVCKHILRATTLIRSRFSDEQLARPYRRTNISLRLHYSAEFGLRFNLPSTLDQDARELIGAYEHHSLLDAGEAVRVLRQLRQAGHEVHIYPDAEKWLDRELTLQHVRQTTSAMQAAPQRHPLREQLLRLPLLPYQVAGVAFAAGAGRAILADEMGLGKTVQAIGVAELLARLADIRRVLIVCPAMLKQQWMDEIARFSRRTAVQVSGIAPVRQKQYRRDSFFTVCNYEQVLRDAGHIEAQPWDLIILDEGQRIRNWESKTSQTIRSLQSDFALVLSGTPLENKLEDLYTIVRFVDERRLGPPHEFLHRHQILDDRGRLTGYGNLDELRTRLRPVLLRRTRSQVLVELPEQLDETIRVAPTDEQAILHEEHVRVIRQAVQRKLLTEMDIMRLQKSLLMCRLAANSTCLVQKGRPSFSSKLDRLAELLEELDPLEDRKILLFSEWRGMLDLVEQMLPRFSFGHVPPGRARAASSAGDHRAAFSGRSAVSSVAVDQRGRHGVEPAGGRHRDPCRFAMEPDRAAATRSASAAPGSAPPGACL